MAHIQTQAARQRYQEYGIQEIEIYADTDNRTCPICAKLDGKRFGINDALPIDVYKVSGLLPEDADDEKN